MPFGLEDVASRYGDCRRRNFKTLRDNKPIRKDWHALPLFGDPEVSPTVVLYAYWGRNQILDRRIVKVGYTSELLAKYLRSLGRQYDPKLMASCPGSKDDEDRFHVNWKQFVAEPPGGSREWYWATELMFNLFRREWTLDSQFDVLAEEALKTSPYLQ